MPKEKSVVLNGETLWSKVEGKVIFARQLEPSYKKLEENEIPMTSILVGFEGAIPENLYDVLAERDSLKSRVTELVTIIQQNKDQELIQLKSRVTKLEGLVSKSFWKVLKSYFLRLKSI